MAIVKKSDQLLYTGRGPLDSKSTVKTYSELLNAATWTTIVNNTDTFVAYNGMIVAVWLDKDNPDKNGLYFLFDPAADTAKKKPDVTLEANWHRIAALSDLQTVNSQLSDITAELTGVKTRLASLEADKVVLRRDNDYNYKQKENTLIPANNEICLVDVAGYGIRVKIGDGLSTFAELSYIDEPILKNIDSLIIKGYFYQEAFYADISHTELLEAVQGRIYIDAASSRLYTYNGINYETQTAKLSNATAEVAGVVKLYDQVGQNIDGTMTQRAITSELDGINDELDDKFEMAVDKDEELLIFAPDLN